MTLILAMKCTDGVVICADSASTDMENRTKQPGTKIFQIGDLPILVGGTGDVGLRQKVLAEFKDQLASIRTKRTMNSLRKELKRITRQEQVEAAQSHVPLNGTTPPTLGLLFAGFLDKEPFILEIGPTNVDTLYPDDMGGFYAVGSGAMLAQSLYRPYLFETGSRTIEVAKVQGYRVLEDAIELSHMGLSHPIHIYSIPTSTQDIVGVEEDEMARIQLTCETWREIQRDSLHTALNPKQREAGDIPLPDDIVNSAQNI